MQRQMGSKDSPWYSLPCELICHISSFLTIREFVPVHESIFYESDRWQIVRQYMKSVWRELDGPGEVKWVSLRGINMSPKRVGTRSLPPGRSTLTQLCLDGDLEAVKFLLKRAPCVKVDGKSSYKRDDGAAVIGTALHAAAYSGHLGIVQALLEAGYGVDVKDSQKSTSLGKACWKGRLEVAKLLLQHGADVESIDRWGWTPLHLASWNGHLDVSKHLLEVGGAYVNAINKWFRGPLHFACYNGHIDLCKYLVSQGASLEPVHRQQKPPLYDAVRNNQHAVAEYLSSLKLRTEVKKVDKTRGHRSVPS